MALSIGNRTSVKQLLLDHIQAKKNEDALAMLQNLKPDELIGGIGMELLHFSARHGNNVVAQHLINLGVNVDVLDGLNRTPLMTALVESSDVQTIEILLNSNADIYHTQNGCSILEVALSSNSADWLIKNAFLRRVISDSLNDSKIIAEKLFTANCKIYYAALLGDADVLQIMLGHGSSPFDSDDKTGRTALHVAVVVKSLKCIKLLIRDRADINAKDKGHLTPLALACNYGESAEEYEIINYLLDEGSSLTRMFSLEDDMTQRDYILIRGKKAIVQTLISRQEVDFIHQDSLGRRSLHHISKNIELFKDPSFIEELKQRRINVNILDNHKRSALHVAAEFKNLRSALYLLESGANVNQQNTQGCSALYFVTRCLSYKTMNASEKRNIHELVELLLRYGADFQLVTQANRTVFDNIVQYQNFDLAKPILAYLALHVDCGGLITELIQTKINSNEILKKEFELCQKHLQEIKPVRLNDSITALNFLFENEKLYEKKIRLFGRNEQNFGRLTELYNSISSDSYFFQLLKRRLEKVFVEIQMSRQVSEFLCRIFESMGCYAIPSVIDKIIDYLSVQDLQNVIQM